MRVLHVFDHSIPLHSGYTFRSLSILRGQRALGWETRHLTSPKHNLEAPPSAPIETVDGFTFYRSRDPDGMSARIPVLNQFAMITATERRLDELVVELRPDILHAHSPALNGEAAVRVGKKHNIPVVYEVRAFWEDAAVDHGTSKEGGLRYRLTRALETRVLKRADAVTTICEGLRTDILQRGIPASKVTVIPNAVDAEQFKFATQEDPALRIELGLQNQQVVGFIGSFYAYEGLDLLVRALPEMLKQTPEIRLLFVGGGPQEKNLKDLVKALDLESKVIFVGRVPHAEVKRYYDLIDILAYPRLPMRLTDLVTPLKPLEALAQGKLLVASDVGGHKELIIDKVTGSLFRSGDASSLARAVTDLLADKECWDERRRSGREFVERERNWPRSVGRYKDVYQSLLASSSKESIRQSR